MEPTIPAAPPRTRRPCGKVAEIVVVEHEDMGKLADSCAGVGLSAVECEERHPRGTWLHAKSFSPRSKTSDGTPRACFKRKSRSIRFLSEASERTLPSRMRFQNASALEGNGKSLAWISLSTTWFDAKRSPRGGTWLPICDANADQKVHMSDPITTLQYLFVGKGPGHICKN